MDNSIYDEHGTGKNYVKQTYDPGHNGVINDLSSSKFMLSNPDEIIEELAKLQINSQRNGKCYLEAIDQLKGKPVLENSLGHISEIIDKSTENEEFFTIEYNKFPKPNKITFDHSQNNEEGVIENLPATAKYSSSNNSFITESSTDNIETSSPIAVETSSSELENNLNSPCSAQRRPMKCKQTFSEKNIRKKILNVLAEKGDIFIECKDFLPNDGENLAYQDTAWINWYASKLMKERQQKQIQEGLESKRKIKEEKERLLRRRSHERYLQQLNERKHKEDTERREQQKIQEMEKQKNATDEERKKKIAEERHVMWKKRKALEKKGMIVIIL